MMEKAVYSGSNSRKVLVVEDVVMNQVLARHIMESWGFLVEVASNGREALKRLDSTLYDIILMDIQMPEMDGIETARHIRKLADPQKAHIPIIALTANTLASERQLYSEAGMNDCLAKPFDENGLLAVTNKWLSSNKQTQIDAEANEAEELSQLYDLTMVRAISGGDEDFVKRMMALFLETMPANMDELVAATAKEDWKQVGKQAHKMKSTIDSMAIANLKEIIRRVELNGRNMEHTDTIPADVEFIISMMKTCLRQVKKDFQL